MPSGLQVVGIGGPPRQGAPMRGKGADTPRGWAILFFGGEREEGERTHGVPLTLDVFVNVNTSSVDRHVNVTVDHARAEKKKGGGGRTRKKFARGLMPI